MPTINATVVRRRQLSFLIANPRLGVRWYGRMSAARIHRSNLTAPHSSAPLEQLQSGQVLTVSVIGKTTTIS
jgi:hypothetical protein